MHNSVRKLTDGAMITAIMGMMLLLNRQTGGLFEGYFLFVYPLPLVFYSAKYGMRQSWIVFVAVLLLCVMFGSIQTVFYMAAECLIGMIYGSGIRKRRSRTMILLVTMGLGALTSVLTSIVFASFFGYDIAAEIRMMQEAADSAMTASGLADAAVLPNLRQLLLEAYVLAAVFSGILTGLVTHLLSLLLLGRLRIPMEPPKPLGEIYPPRWSGYAALAGMLMYYAVSVAPLENDILQMTLQGIGLAATYFLVCFGIIGTMVWLRSRIPSAGVGWLFLIAVAGILLSVLTAAAGFLYLSTDLHRILMEGADPDEK